ncbi:LysR family transcriptional regulator [Bradyrhizobium sp. C-145]|uniref:LysR family transcriptional regulator n=1 Tax=Bradyrhizobium sp. C-145 TaxID=574727 RepID=UPI00201B59C3|nr:LysR family transcriptional regulator [Bradyrhizobium sp. C-145]UQR66640.1 LysR family transcriptional regulator [Bradyrhizobium sp. C-145]
MNWDDVRIFLAIYRAGTLVGAGLALGVDQTTVGRRLAALEKRLGSILFLRTNAGYVLTASGEEALRAGEAMERLAVSFEHRSVGSDARVAGDVRVTTTDSLAIDFVIPAIDRVRIDHPDIRVILTTTTKLLDLGRREADIAVRTLRPAHSDLIVRRLAEWEVGLYASRKYLDARGRPRRGSAFAGHDLAIYQPGVTNRQGATLAGESVAEGKIIAELDSSLMLASVVRAGLALGELPTYHAKRDPDLVRIWPMRKRAAPYEVWLVLHADLARAARVRVVVDAIAAMFEAKQKVAVVS